MPRFFSRDIDGDTISVTGPDFTHIRDVLRMRISDVLTVCDMNGTDHTAEIISFEQGRIRLRIISSKPSEGEPRLRLHLFQALPKSDKLDTIVQKATELGAARITPFLSKRCVSRPDGKSTAKKTERLSRIAYEAAKQCGRGVPTQIDDMQSFDAALELAAVYPLFIVFYEEGGESLKEILKSHPDSAAIMTGPEGGFEAEEIEAARARGARIATLGKRILRCETAPLAAMSAIMFEAGEME